MVSDTFVVCLRRIDRVPVEPLPWLYAVARKTLANERRKRARVMRGGLAPVAEPAPVGDGALAIAFKALSERDREVLRLVAWEGLSLADTAPCLAARPSPAASATTARRRGSRRGSRGYVLSTRARRSNEMSNDMINRLTAANPVPSDEPTPSAEADSFPAAARCLRGRPRGLDRRTRDRVCGRLGHLLGISNDGAPVPVGTVTARRDKARRCDAGTEGRRDNAVPRHAERGRLLRGAERGRRLLLRDGARRWQFGKGFGCDLNADNFPSATSRR